MTLKARIAHLRQDFSKEFWTANTLELFERLAYYGANSAMAIFLAERAGLREEAGTLTGTFSAIIYLLPLVAGVLVDRYGFRKTLIACFAFFTVGYFMIALAGIAWGEPMVNTIGRRTYVIGVLMLTAIGGSLIKPCIVGTVAKTTTEASRAQGFSIYYSLVNLGGAIGPLIALVIRKDLGIEYVLVMSSFTSLLLLIGTFLFFGEPKGSGEKTEVRTFAVVLAEAILVFKNLKFMLFLVIFSGFWIMFWQIYHLLPFYAMEVLHFEQFELLLTIDAWCIIFLSVLIAAMFRKWSPFTAMMIGFVFASASWLIIGISGSTMAVVIGVILFAIGEATQAPRFYEYVSLMAPPSLVGTYMGFSFLPIAIGSFGSGVVADWLRLNYMQTEPQKMWFIIAGIGLVTTILMIFYNRIFVRKRTTH